MTTVINVIRNWETWLFSKCKYWVIYWVACTLNHHIGRCICVAKLCTFLKETKNTKNLYFLHFVQVLYINSHIKTHEQVTTTYFFGDINQFKMKLGNQNLPVLPEYWPVFIFSFFFFFCLQPGFGNLKSLKSSTELKK